MNENEHSFRALRRLLALKRHETPPPGYFENFSREVMARIRAGEQGGPARAELPWLWRLVQVFEAKPAFAGAFASAMCLLLLAGIVYAERPEIVPQPLLQSAPTAGPLAAVTQTGLNPQPAETSAFVSSTNPVFNSQSVSPLFGQANATVQPVSFLLTGAGN